MSRDGYPFVRVATWFSCRSTDKPGKDSTPIKKCEVRDGGGNIY